MTTAATEGKYKINDNNNKYINFDNLTKKAWQASPLNLQPVPESLLTNMKLAIEGGTVPPPPAGGLSTGAIIGISVAAAVLGLIVGVMRICFGRRRGGGFDF